MLNWFNFDLRKAFITTALVILPLISINTQQKPIISNWYDRPFSFIGNIVEQAFFLFSDGIRGTTRLYLDLIDIKRENQSLKAQNRELLSRLQEMEELSKENYRLRALLDFRQKNKMELVAARIMSRDLLSEHATIRIDKGSNHGLKTGMAVITTEGVVGHIFRPELYSSQVLLVTDRYSVVDGLVSRSRARGLVEGKSGNGIALHYVDKSEDVKMGDLIVTSGLDNIFPKGFPVAVVDAVENKPFAVSLKVDIHPIVDPDKIEEVFVVTDAKYLDFNKTAKAQSEDTP